MNEDILVRTVGASADIIKGLNTGLYKLYGGVVRFAGGEKGGQIVSHLKIPSDPERAQKSLEGLLGQINSPGAQGSIGVLEGLQAANLALTGLNLAVSAAGFVVVCNKLNGISDQLSGQSEKLDSLLEMAKEAKLREEMLDYAKFSAVLDNIRQFSGSNDVAMLTSQITSLREQYAVTRMTLRHAAMGLVSGNAIQSLDVINNLQRRMMYLGFLQSYVQQKIGAADYAHDALFRLNKDWREINEAVIDSIIENKEWVEELPYDVADNVVSFLEYRKVVSPAIEYQESLLELAVGNPAALNTLVEDVDEIQFLAA